MSVKNHVAFNGGVTLKPEFMPAFHVLKDFLNLGGGADKLAGSRKPPLIAKINRVDSQSSLVEARPSGYAAASDKGSAAAPGGKWRSGHAGARDPGIVGGVKPIFIGQSSKAALAPLRPPRVLHQEANLVIANQGEGMSTQRYSIGGASNDMHHVGAPLHHYRLNPAIVDGR